MGKTRRKISVQDSTHIKTIRAKKLDTTVEFKVEDFMGDPTTGKVYLYGTQVTALGEWLVEIGEELHNRGGRPTKYGDEVINQIKAELDAGMNVTTIAKMLRMPRTSVSKIKNVTLKGKV